MAKLNKLLPPRSIVAESWEISAHANGPSLVCNGILAGQTLNYVLKHYPEDLLGDFNHKPYTNKFPFLIKFIDACDDLSVQVHPNDKQARALEQEEMGKNEMWYILAADPGSKLILGTRPGISKEDFAKAIVEDNITEELFNELPVKAGDTVNIPAGLVHAIGKGIIICEIQQNSDTTYRVYDYHRVDQQGQKRPLHVDKALSVIDFSLDSPRTQKPKVIFSKKEGNKSNKKELLLLDKWFKVEKWHVESSLASDAVVKRFKALTIIQGEGKISWFNQDKHVNEELHLQLGDSLLIPANITSWRVTGSLEFLNTTLPHNLDQKLL